MSSSLSHASSTRQAQSGQENYPAPLCEGSSCAQRQATAHRWMTRALVSLVAFALSSVSLSTVSLSTVALSSASLLAQVTPQPMTPSGTPAPAQTPATPMSQEVEVSQLDTVYLRGEDGKLYPFIDIPFEVFEKIYEQQVGGVGDELPQAYTIERIDSSGVIESSADVELAVLTVRFTVTPHRSGWVSVPLNLGDATLTSWDAGEHREQVLIVETNPAGFTAWVQGGSDQSIEFSLQIVKRVTRQGAQSQLQLSLPSSTLSQLSLDLPLADPEVILGGDRLIPQVEAIADGRSRLTVSGPLADAPIRWRPRTDDAASGLSVVTDITVQIDGPDLVRYQATLDVVSLNGRDREFLVRLPEGARFDATEQLEIEVEELEPSDPLLAELPADARYVSVTFPQPLSKPTRVVLFASRSGLPMDQPTSSTQLAVGGFEVLRAVRQSGSIVLIGSRDWRVDWSAGSFLRQVSLQESDRDREGAVARFQFSRAPIDLTAKIVRNESRSACEPILDISFWRDRMQLDAEFRYSFSGPRPETLLIDSRGWPLDVDQLVSQRWIRRASVDPTDPDLWRLDLDPGLSDETLVIRISLSKPMERFGELQIPLPSPLASTVSAAMVSLRSTDDLEILPRLSAVQGTIVPGPNPLVPSITPSTTPETSATTSASTSPTGSTNANPQSTGLPSESLVQWLRIQSLNDVESLDCRVTVRPQRIDVTSQVSVRLEEDTARVTQIMDYSIRYVPMTGGLLAIDRSVLENGQLELRVGGTVVATRSETSAIEALDSNWELLRFETTHGVTGPLRVEASFSIDLKQPTESDETSLVTIPLLIPLQTPDQRARGWASGIVRTVSGLAIQPIGDLAREVQIDAPLDRVVVASDDSWRLEEQTSSGERRSFLMTKVDRDATRSVSFELGVGQASVSQAPRVLAAWIQTLCAPEYRRDRVTLRVATNRPSIDLNLPAFVRLMTVAVDGVEQPGLSEQVVGRRLSVSLGSNAPRGEHTIELWYRFPRNRSFDRSIDLDLPGVDQVDWMEQVYWEVVLPQNEYVLVQPLRMISENRTDWSWFGWTETPRMSSADLEARLGVTAQAPLDPTMRRQLYSTFGDSISGKVWTARRWEVLTVGSAVLFVIGMLAVLVRLHQRPIVALLSVAIAFAAAATIQPAGQWIAQLAIFVSIFVALGAYLHWLWARPARRLVTRPATAVERSGNRPRDPESHRSQPRRTSPTSESMPTAAHEEVRA